MSGVHARLSASAADRWMNCPGSLNQATGLPDRTSRYAAEGTVAHLVAADAANGLDPSTWLGKKETADGFDIEVDQEMVDAAKNYAAELAQYQTPEWIWRVETDLSSLQTLDPDFGGTSDFAAYNTAAAALVVVDFKYGQGVLVDVEDNTQLKMYALGVMLSTPRTIKKVKLVIVQPRHEAGDAVREWEFDAYEIMDFAADLTAAASKTREKDAPLNPGDWCKYCKAAQNMKCPAVEAKRNELIAMDFNTALVDTTKIAAALNMIPIVKKQIEMVEKLAYEEACRGNVVPGYKLVEKRPVRKYSVPDEAVVKFATDNKVDPYAERSLLSPAQLEKKLPKAVKDALSKLVTKVSSGTTLVPETDNRSPVAKVAVTDFNITGEANNA